MIKSFRELTVYQKAFEQAVRIFEVMKRFPKEELSPSSGTRRVDSWIRRDRQDARLDDLGPREVLLQRSKGRFMRLPAGRCQLPANFSR